NRIHIHYAVLTHRNACGSRRDLANRELDAPAAITGHRADGPRRPVSPPRGGYDAWARAGLRWDWPGTRAPDPRIFSSLSASTADEAGFCPVIRVRSSPMYGFQIGPLLVPAPALALR